MAFFMEKQQLLPLLPPYCHPASPLNKGRLQSGSNYRKNIFILELHAPVHIEDGRIGGNILVVELYGTIVQLGMLALK